MKHDKPFLFFNEGTAQIKYYKVPLDLNLQIAAEDLESRKKMLREAQETIKFKRKEAKANAERSTKAEWTISLCNRRVIHLYTS